ncbi:hypothetical protein M9Y10_035607 [Tritrichomonas musculus]|uniref:Transmembrane protein n=1 Tax=Tritrichomonas musculus TaxID=1915356 RepID=A0ABR2GW99_9EUKA
MTQTEQDDQFINSYMITNDDDQDSVAVKTSFCPHIRWFPFIIAIIFFLLGLVNMIVFYVIPDLKIKENKRKLPDARFQEPNPVLIFIHFLFHSCVMLFGISLLLFALRGFVIKHTYIIIILLIVTCSLTFIFWVTYASLSLVSTHDPEQKINIDQIISLTQNDSPIDFAFVFSKDTVKIRDCYRNPNSGQLVCTNRYLPCYSETGVSIPLKSKVTSAEFDFSRVPDIFYFEIIQEINKSAEFSTVYDKIVDDIDECDYWDKDVEYYPIINATYIVSRSTTPSYLTHRTRILSATFGVGLYYEMYTKSIPFISYQQEINIDVDPKVNYDNIWTSESCSEYGQCSQLNQKPTPK